MQFCPPFASSLEAANGDAKLPGAILSARRLVFGGHKWESQNCPSRLRKFSRIRLTRLNGGDGGVCYGQPLLAASVAAWWLPGWLSRRLLFCKFCLSCSGRPDHAGLPPRAHAHRMVALSEERAMWAQKQTGRPEQASPIKEHHA